MLKQVNTMLIETTTEGSNKTLYHVMNDLSKPVKEKEQLRYDNLCKEFGLV